MSFLTDTNRVKDTAGFGPPQFGGVLNARFGTVTYQDTTARALFTLPEGAMLVGWVTNVDEGFDDTGTDLLDLGDGTTADRFAADLDVSALGQIVNGYAADELFVALTEETTVYGTFTGQNGNAAHGSATVCVLYIIL